MFVTFYSYKGGVGRTMALANIACYLAQDENHPQRILLWDFDLEAPGLHCLFPPQEPRKYGFVDLAHEFAKRGEFNGLSDYIYTSAIANVDVLPAGSMGASYCEKLQEIDWLGFFGSEPSEPSSFFSQLLQAIEEMQYDYVLMDSRTGLNDQAGICTQVLPQMLLIFLRLNDQHLDGLTHLVPAIRAQHKLRNKEDVAILPVASPIFADVAETGRATREKALRVFNGESLGCIQFDQKLAHEESLFCLRERLDAMWPTAPVVADYISLCETIRERNPHDTRTATDYLRMKMSSGDNVSASHILHDLLRKRPRVPRLWGWLRWLEAEAPSREHDVEWEQLVSAILEDDPENSFAYEWLAGRRLLYADSDSSELLEEARQQIEEAIKRDPKRATPYRMLADIASCSGDLDAAVAALRKSKELLPENAQVLLDLANAHMRMGADYFATAADEFEEVSPEAEDTKYIPLTYLRSFLGQERKAAEAFDAYLGLEERWQITRLHEAHYRLAGGDVDGGKEIAEKALKSEDERPRAMDLENWAEFFLCAEDFARASQLLKCVDKQNGVAPGERALGALLTYLDSQGTETDAEEVLAKWRGSSWSFAELIVFRERVRRAGRRKLEARLKIVERLIRQQRLERARYRPSPVVPGRALLRRRRGGAARKRKLE